MTAILEQIFCENYSATYKWLPTFLIIKKSLSYVLRILRNFDQSKWVLRL